MSIIKNGDKVLVKDNNDNQWSSGYLYVGKSPIKNNKYPHVVQDVDDLVLEEYAQVRLAPSEEEVALEEIRGLMRKHGLKEVKL